MRSTDRRRCVVCGASTAGRGTVDPDGLFCSKSCEHDHDYEDETTISDHTARMHERRAMGLTG